MKLSDRCKDVFKASATPALWRASERYATDPLP